MWRRLVIVVAVVAVAAGVAFVLVHRGEPAPPAVEGAVGFDAPDLVNPMRGQFDNIVTGLFPQSNEAQSALPDWPGTRDAAIRLTWRELEPQRGRYDFSLLDRALDEYEQRGMRVALRVSTYDSCCEHLSPGDRNLSVPDWLASTPGAVEEIDRDGVTQVIPLWNSAAYLDPFDDLLAELGRRYDGDERLSVWEMSGYGDFGENVISLMRDQLGRPGPSVDESEAELGYLSQYEDQFITATSVDRLVAANLRAFPRTQIVSAPANPYMMKQLLRDSPALEGVAHPVGIRADCLGVFDVVPTWAGNEYSRYVEQDDPIVDVLVDRLRTAPVLTEWCQLPDDVKPVDYYQRGLDTVIQRHVSMTASSGFPDQFGESTMADEVYRLWRSANVFAGYRYAAAADLTADDMPITGRVTWSNLGVAPTHERWSVVYQLRNSTGDVVDEVSSAIDLSELAAEQDPKTGTPTAATITDDLAFAPSALAPGQYTVTVRVDWAEHKRDATHRVDFPPMFLALENRLDDGSYEIGSVQVRS